MNPIKNIDIEKLLILKTFFLFLSFALFTDSLLIILSNITIRDISFSLVKENIGNIFLILLLYTFFMSILIKSFVAIVIYGYTYLPEFFQYDDYSARDEDYHSAYKLKNIAIKHNNSVLYKFYEQKENILEDIEIFKYLAVSILILFIVNYVISSETQISLIKMYLDFFYTGDNTLYYKLFNTISIILIIVILIKAISNSKNFPKIYLDKKVLDYIEQENAKKE